MLHRILMAAGAGLLVGLTSGAASAQIRGSEAAVVAQTIDGTTLTLEYSRPSARGRTLFGELVPWDIVWTPGANWATTLEVDRDVRLNDIEVPAGRYSVWMIPREQAPWTVTLNPEHRIFHFVKPDSADGQIHIAADPETAPHEEMLTWGFPAVSGDGAILRFRWGATAVPLRVVVQPSKPLALEAQERARYTGAYRLEFMDGSGWPKEGRFEVVELDGRLRGRLPFPIHPGDELEFDLVPAGRDRFNPGLYRDGELFNVEMGGTFEFELVDGRAAVVRLRAINGLVLGEGGRAGDGA